MCYKKITDLRKKWKNRNGQEASYRAQLVGEWERREHVDAKEKGVRKRRWVTKSIKEQIAYIIS